MANELAPVYLDDARVQLQGDPRPKVSKIVTAGGKHTTHLRVVRLASLADETGEVLQLDDVIDRSQQRSPVYLRCIGEDEATGTAKPQSFQADERTGMGASDPLGNVQQGSHGVGRQAPDDLASSSTGQRPIAQFGAARTGMAGQGAQGTRGKVPVDKQTLSDYDPGMRSGDRDQAYGVGDLAPGGRTGLTEGLGRGPGEDHSILDGTQGFQSGGRQGEGGAPGYTDASVGSRGLAAESQGEHDEGIGAAGIRDSSTDHAGRQQGQRPKRPSAVKDDAKDGT